MHPRNKFLSAVIHQLWLKISVLVMCAALGFIWANGKTLIEEKIIAIMRPRLEAIAHKQDNTDRHLGQIDQKFDALISILVESSPEIRRAAQRRIQKDWDSEEVKNSLRGSAP